MNESTGDPLGTEPHHSCGPLLHQPVHSIISQLDKPSRMMSRCWSILHSAYMVRTALIASLCAGPVPPLRASSRLRQIHVARLRRLRSGVPNQYLPASHKLLDSLSGADGGIQTTNQQDGRVVGGRGAGGRASVCVYMCMRASEGQ